MKLKELKADALTRLTQYDEYVKICKEKGYFPKRLDRWLKENKRDEPDLIEVVLLEFKGKKSDSILTDTGNEKTKPKQKVKTNSRKRKQPEPSEDGDDISEMEKTKKSKPSTIFSATFSLPFLWVYKTLILLISKINDGYFVTTRRKAERSIPRSQASIFP